MGKRQNLPRFYAAIRNRLLKLWPVGEVSLFTLEASIERRQVHDVVQLREKGSVASPIQVSRLRIRFREGD